MKYFKAPQAVDWETGSIPIGAGQKGQEHTVSVPRDMHLQTFTVCSSGNAVRVVGIIVEPINDLENIVEVSAWYPPMLRMLDVDVEQLRERATALGFVPSTAEYKPIMTPTLPVGSGEDGRLTVVLQEPMRIHQISLHSVDVFGGNAPLAERVELTNLRLGTRSLLDLVESSETHEGRALLLKFGDGVLGYPGTHVTFDLANRGHSTEMVSAVIMGVV